jgi:hypothetical protein
MAVMTIAPKKIPIMNELVAGAARAPHLALRRREVHGGPAVVVPDRRVHAVLHLQRRAFLVKKRGDGSAQVF